MIYLPLQNHIQLGNYLFQYAAALSIGQKVAIYPNGDECRRRIAGYPSIFANVPIVDALPPDTREYVQPDFRFHAFPKELSSGNWVIKGFYQSEKFIRDKSAIRELFGPSSDLVAALMERYGAWLQKPNITGINVRHGKDYLSEPEKFPFVGHGYFRECMARLPECRSFIVTSDDIGWCKKYFPKKFPDREFFFVEGEPTLNDMYIMSLCQNNIISNGTFSWWGAWLNKHTGKRVFAPSQWFGPIVEKTMGHIWDDIYFEGMEVIDNHIGELRRLKIRVLVAKKKVVGWLVTKLHNAKAMVKRALGRNRWWIKILLFPAVLVVRWWRKVVANPLRISQRLFAYDCRCFSRHAGCFHEGDKDALIARIVMAYHVLEKGLTMPKRRLGFGHDAVLDLMSIVEAFEHNFGKGEKMVNHAVGVVKEYLAMHEAAGFDFTADELFWARVKSFCAGHQEIPPCKQLHVKAEEFFALVNAPFPEFAASRHTCRHYAGELPLATVKKAVELAMTAPSACNRQHVRVHCVSSHAKRDVIYTLQNGNRGFGQDADKLLVITSDLNCLRWNEERNDIYTNAGMFLMNLCYALHYYKVAHCVLNWSVGPESDKMMHSLLGIPENERIAALIACGPMPPEADIAASPRKDFDDVFFNHE